MIDWLKRLPSWIVEVFNWLGEAKQTWIALFAIPVVFLWWFFILPGWELRIRITGMSLELLGLGTVALGIAETHKLFKRPGVVKTAGEWLGRFPKFQRKLRISTGTGHLNVQGQSTASAVGYASLTATASLEERVASLERSLDRAIALIHETQRTITAESQKLGSALDAARCERELGDGENAKLIQKAMADGLHLEVIGVLWLFFGIIFATASNEILTVPGHIANFLRGFN